MSRIPVLVPGIFGSTLSYGNRTIWGRYLLENFWELKKDNGLLTWGRNAATADFIETFELLPGIGSFSIWSRCVEVLEGAFNIRPSKQWVRFGYDWRQSLITAASQLCSTLSAHVGVNVQAPPPNHISDRLLLVSHSMGGLVVRAALGLGELDPTWCDRLIQIGTPIQGAPAAMRGAYDPNEWPFLADLFRVAWTPAMPSRYVLIKAMQMAARTFESAYQLLPPPKIAYAYQKMGSPFFNPLSLPESKFSVAQIALAKDLEIVLQLADEVIETNQIPLYCVYAEKLSTCMLLEIDCAGSSYAVRNAVILPEGDGTVPAYSAKGPASSVSLSVDYVAHEWLCNDKKVMDRVRAAL